MSDPGIKISLRSIRDNNGVVYLDRDDVVNCLDKLSDPRNPHPAIVFITEKFRSVQ